MIEVQFGNDHKKIIAAFNALKVHDTKEWNKDEYAEIRKIIKDHYLQEQNYMCQFCRQKFKVKHNRVWDVEHIIPRSTHPQFTFTSKNLCVICPDCNNEKNSGSVLNREQIQKFPTASSAYKICHPHFDIYNEHIDAIVPGQLYKWHSSKGRYTIRIYGLDRFLKGTGRSKKLDQNSSVFRLMTSAMADDEDYATHEKKLLEELLLKHSANIGHENTINTLRALRESNIKACSTKAD